MRRLIVFNQVSLDGYFTGENGDLGWAHQQDAEWNDFVSENASGESVLVFGRITYEMMVSFWPTPSAEQYFPVIAKKMNNTPKIVFSRTMNEALWNNARLIKKI